MKDTTQRWTEHSTFVIERTYDASPERVFAAFARKDLKAKWFGEEEGWTTTQWEMDFREGGRELHVSQEKSGGPVFRLVVNYLDIVENERIVYAYVMHVGEAKLSASLATVEITRRGGLSALKLTEQGVYLDGHDRVANREAGTRALLDALARAIQS